MCKNTVGGFELDFFGNTHVYLPFIIKLFYLFLSFSGLVSREFSSRNCDQELKKTREGTKAKPVKPCSEVYLESGISGGADSTILVRLKRRRRGISCRISPRHLNDTGRTALSPQDGTNTVCQSQTFVAGPNRAIIDRLGCRTNGSAGL